MLRTILVTIMLAGLATAAVAESVYKWADGKGQIYYTDRPPTAADAKLLAVLDRDQSFVEEEGGPQGSSNAPPPASGRPSDSNADRVQQDVDRVRADQCKQAQERYKTYVESRRLFRQTEDGQREYLSDEELMQARIEARQAMDEYCN